MFELKMDVVWENDQLLVINKPSGVICERDEHLVDWPIIAHRLDKETSGGLIMAKNLRALKFMMKQFKDRKVDKQYLALVHGWIEPKIGRIRLPMANIGRGDVRQGIRYDGKQADSAWETLERLETDLGKLTLLRVRIFTGRTHQIRVHLAHLGYPVFSDSQYLNKRQLKLDRGRLKRHFLHAERLEFNLPRGGRREVVIEPASELQNFIYGNKKTS